MASLFLTWRIPSSLVCTVVFRARLIGVVGISSAHVPALPPYRSCLSRVFVAASFTLSPHTVEPQIRELSVSMRCTFLLVGMHTYHGTHGSPNRHASVYSLTGSNSQGLRAGRSLKVWFLGRVNQHECTWRQRRHLLASSRQRDVQHQQTLRVPWTGERAVNIRHINSEEPGSFPRQATNQFRCSTLIRIPKYGISTARKFPSMSVGGIGSTLTLTNTG